MKIDLVSEQWPLENFTYIHLKWQSVYLLFQHSPHSLYHQVLRQLTAKQVSRFCLSVTIKKLPCLQVAVLTAAKLYRAHKRDLPPNEHSTNRQCDWEKHSLSITCFCRQTKQTKLSLMVDWSIKEEKKNSKRQKHLNWRNKFTKKRYQKKSL